MLDVSRKELKYSLHPAEAARLKKRLSFVMQGDPHNGTIGYRVRSLYFDTVVDGDFEDKVNGLEKRQKVRLRTYNTGAEIIKLELKEKTDTAQRKRSLSLNREEAVQMIKGEYSFLLKRGEPLAGWMYGFLVCRCYRPKCIVEYDRFAFILDNNDTRITFDSNIRASEAGYDLFDENLVLYPVASPNDVTLEVKYNGFLMTFVKNELATADKIWCSNSKYCRARMISKKGRR